MFKRIFLYVAAPIIKFPIFSLSIFVVLCIPTLLYLYADGPLYKLPWRLFLYFRNWHFLPELTFIYCYHLLLLLCKRFAPLYKGVAFFYHMIGYGVACVETLLVVHFGSFLNPFMLQLVKQSDVNESVDFLKTYVWDLKFIIPSLVIVSVAILECFLLRKNLCLNLSEKINDKIKSLLITCLGVFLFMGFISNIRVAMPDSLLRRIDILDLNGNNPSTNLISSINMAFFQFSSESDLFEKCARAQEDLKLQGCSFLSENIILIIGESYNRHHSSLYGYEVNTSPLLGKMHNLYVFDDVVSSVNSTARSFRNFLSLASVGKNNWYDTPLFPCLFNKAGYNVIFWSNQFVREIGMGFFDASCGFFYHPDIEPILFTTHNVEKFQYDEDLLGLYKVSRDSVEKEKNNLIIFHLNGQHINPESKFPANRAVFGIKDYSNRGELSDKEKMEVANYDNATLYNDSIVYEIMNMYSDKDAIVLYFADHGEESNDYRSHIGRCGNFAQIGAPVLHCQLDIPFVVYVSDLYKEKHPDIVDRIEQSTHKPFMTDDLSHLLIGLGGIETGWYDSSKDLFSSGFNDKRKRFVRDWDDWSLPIDYDSICSAYGPWKIGWSR